MTKLQAAEQSRGCSTAVQTVQGVRQMTNLGGHSPTGGGSLPGHFKETTRCADKEIWMDVPTCYVQTRRLELIINVQRWARTGFLVQNGNQKVRWQVMSSSHHMWCKALQSGDSMVTTCQHTVTTLTTGIIEEKWEQVMYHKMTSLIWEYHLKTQSKGHDFRSKNDVAALGFN